MYANPKINAIEYVYNAVECSPFLPAHSRKLNSSNISFAGYSVQWWLYSCPQTRQVFHRGCLQRNWTCSCLFRWTVAKHHWCICLLFQAKLYVNTETLGINYLQIFEMINKTLFYCNIYRCKFVFELHGCRYHKVYWEKNHSFWLSPLCVITWCISFNNIGIWKIWLCKAPLSLEVCWILEGLERSLFEREAYSKSQISRSIHYSVSSQ